MNQDLPTFLRARLDEDEHAAREANVKQDDAQWWVSPLAASWPRTYRVRSARDNRSIATVQDLAGDDEDDPQGILDGAAASAHIARHDPARVLADVNAKRRIVALWAEDWPEWHGFGSGLTRTQMTDDQFQRVLDAERVLGFLALPYAEHPDYKEEWRP